MMFPPSPSPSPSQSPLTQTVQTIKPRNPSSLDFSPPLIAMVVVVAAAFVAITYSRLISRHLILLHRRYRRYRRRRRLLRSYVPSPDLESGDPSDGFHVSPSPFGLDDSVIKSIPRSMFSLKSSGAACIPDCAVCLLEFEDKEYVRTLPVCRHAFHVDCIDIWLRSHPNCPLCRSGVTFRPEPMMSSRIRPSLDDMIFANAVLEPLDPLEEAPEAPEHDHPARASSGEITQELGGHQRDFLLKRSYSFSFERNLGSERLAFEPAMTSPWRYRKGLGEGFWNKRASPFGSMAKPRLFSFRYYKGMKSPFFRRGRGFFPLSERGGSSSRQRSKSMASPMFMRSAGPTVGTFSSFSSSRLRSGDPEALLSPDRFNPR